MTATEQMREALEHGRVALSHAIGRLEAHWEVCADPFPDASLRRALDRIDQALGNGHVGREPICQTCDGRGLLNADRPGYLTCTACDGSGKSGRQA